MVQAARIPGGKVSLVIGPVFACAGDPQSLHDSVVKPFVQRPEVHDRDGRRELGEGHCTAGGHLPGVAP